MNYSEEQDMKAGLDKDIIKRLLSYTKGYQKYIGLSFVLLIFVIAIELARPIIIGVAVDDIISNYDKIKVEEVNGQSVVSRLVIASNSETYYLLDQIDENLYNEFFEMSEVMSESADSLTLKIGDENYNLKAQNKDELKIYRSNDFESLGAFTALFLAITVLGIIVNYFQMLLLHFTGQNIIYRIRNEIFSHIQRMSVQFFNNQPVGKIVTRVTNDTETLNEMYTSVIVDSVKSVLMLIGITVTMLILNWRLTFYVFMVVPFILLSAHIFRKYSRKIYRDVRTKVAKINTFLSEHISGMRIVQMFSREEAVLGKFKKENKSLLDTNLKQLLLFSFFRPTMYLFYVIAMMITLYFGGSMVIEGAMTIGIMVMFLQYTASFFDPIQQLAEQFNILQSAMAAAEKIFTLLDDTSRIEDKEDAIELEGIKGKIEFKNVWFAYDKENWVLKDISFVVEPGETAAFVGATGAGKTSILNLITKYYEIQKGEIYIDGINIDKINKHSIRKYVGQMLQDVFVFTGDINSNIRLKNPKISQTEIVDSAKYVNAHKFINQLPYKYEERTYERGATYSAGQRQLLSFARTLAFKPSVLVLDEATANIDTETEVLIQDALEKIMDGRTTLVVAHRLSTIQHADKIIVLHKGRIRESGNHQELLANEGLYYNLYQLQYKDVV